MRMSPFSSMLKIASLAVSNRVRNFASDSARWFCSANRPEMSWKNPIVPISRPPSWSNSQESRMGIDFPVLVTIFVSKSWSLPRPPNSSA